MSEDYLKAIIDLDALNDYTSFDTYLPCEALKPYIERFWSIKWDLPKGTCYDQKIIPNPHVSLVWYLNPQLGTWTPPLIEGVVKELFTYRLTGQGQILGVKFRIGGFNRFVKNNMKDFTGQKLAIDDYLPTLIPFELKTNTVVENNIATIERALVSCPSMNLKQGRKAEQLVNYIHNNKHITTVEELASSFDLSIRSIQRLFSTYVGVNPKWVIRIYRLQELKSQIESKKTLDWVDTAYQLGYSDQAHMINDFKSILGMSPEIFKSH